MAAFRKLTKKNRKIEFLFWATGFVYHRGMYFWDLLAVLGYFTLVMGVGLASSRRSGNSVQEFSLGGRRMPWGAVLASIIAAELSAATFLGTPGEGYALRNFTYAQLAIGTILARVIVAYLFILPFYTLKVVSIYEFLEKRFGPVTRNAASAVFLLTRLLASGTRLYVAAVVVVLAYEMIYGVMPTDGEKIEIYAGSVLLVTFLTTLYTAAGGIRAVVWTDVIQATVMGSAVIYALVSLLQGVGGWSHAQTFLTQPTDLRFWATGTDGSKSFLTNVYAVLGSEYTLWAALLGSTFTTMATHGTDQDMVQRMLTARDHQKSRLALILSGVADLPINLAFLFIGILLAVFYQMHPDPALPVKNPEIFAYYILHQLPPGARGLLIAGVLATAMGSLSTALNALATSFTQDFWVPLAGKNAAPEIRVQVVQRSTVVFAVLLALIGIATAAVVVYSPKARIIPIVLGVFGYTYGSLLGIFLVGLTTKTRGSERGNLLAMAWGFLGVAILSGLPWDVINVMRGQSSNLGPLLIHLIQEGWMELKGGYVQAPAWLPQIEFPWRVMFGTVITFLVAVSFPAAKKPA